MIIGIGGISRAGKDVISRGLAKRVRQKRKTACVIHQDEYIQNSAVIPRIRDRIDWECPGSLDFDAFYQAIIEARDSHDMVFAEGLMCFYDPRIRHMFQIKIFIQITWTTFLQRRKRDVRWTTEDEPDWYIRHVWDSYFTYGRPSLNSSYLLVNGDVDIDLDPILENPAWVF